MNLSFKHPAQALVEMYQELTPHYIIEILNICFKYDKARCEFVKSVILFPTLEAKYFVQGAYDPKVS